MWKRLKELFWFIETLFFDSSTYKIDPLEIKFMETLPKKNRFKWWCGNIVMRLDNNIEKVIREKYFTRYNIRGNQAREFETWIYYYLVLFTQFMAGKPWVSIKGAYYTCPFIVESLYFENKPESIYYIYPSGRWKNFKIKDRQKSWREGRKYWKTWIKENYESNNLGRDKKEQ